MGVWAWSLAILADYPHADLVSVGLGTLGFGLGVLRFWQITLILIWCLWVWEPWGLGIWWAVSPPPKPYFYFLRLWAGGGGGEEQPEIQLANSSQLKVLSSPDESVKIIP